MPSSYDYDLFVIGAGSGGVRASRIAATLGAKVAIAENLYLGGTCVNVGCVPKKLFVYGAEFKDSFEQASRFGWNIAKPEFSWTTLRDNKTSEINRLNSVYLSLLTNSGVELINGFASFVDAHTVRVGEREYSAERILIATGGWPTTPNFPGAEHVITSNDVFSLPELPKRVLVQGGGYIAVEFAGIFNGLGCQTELTYRRDLFLRGFDAEIREFVANQVTAKGVKLSFNTDIESITKNTDGTLRVLLTTGEHREVDAVFSAIGRKPKVDGLALENAGVEINNSGAITVDNKFKTSAPNIYAVGDVTGGIQLTPVALAEGMALAKHWFSNEPLAVDYQNIPTAVFCQPNIATVGLTEEDALNQSLDYEIYSSQFKPMKLSFERESPEKMLMKLLVDKPSQKILGAHMVGHDAGEIIQGIAIAMKAGATKADFDSTIGIHPTAAEEFVTMREPRRA